MRFNFKQIASVLASIAMVGSTIGIAAAANYPAPFVQNGAADVAVIVGASSLGSDSVGAANIAGDLSTKLAIQTASSGTTSSVTTGGAESVLITGPTKLNIGNKLIDSKAVAISKTDLPTLLASKTYQSKDGVSYNYDQTIVLGGVSDYTLFADSEYKNYYPTLGVKIPDGQVVFNYTATFTKALESDVSTAGRLEDIENTDITLLGKTYKLLNAYNATDNLKLELMGGAVSKTLSLNEEGEYKIGDKTYKVILSYVDATNAKFNINGEDTVKMAIGATQKLSDGTQVGVRDVLYQNFAGGVMKAEFSLGAEKLTLENAAAIKLNDVSNNDIFAYIVDGYSGSKRTISSITLVWKPNAIKFLTEEQPLPMPALNALKLVMAAPTRPATETIKLQATGTKTMAVAVPLKTGKVTINLLSGDGANFTNIGGDGIGKNLVTKTGAASTVTFNRSADNAIVATYKTTAAGESYYLGINPIIQEDGITYTGVRDLYDGVDICSKINVNNSGTCTINNVVLTFSTSGNELSGKTVNITGGSGVNFDRIISAQGLEILLPVDGDANISKPNGINTNATNAGATWKFYAYEEDKNSNIGVGSGNGGVINATIGWASDSKTGVTLVSATNLSGGAFIQIPDTSSTSIGYMQSDLGSKITYDTVPTQDTLEIEYYGGESYGNVLITTADASVSSTGVSTGVVALGKVTVKDSEISAVQGKNLIVVGGSCINTVAAKLLGSDTPLCGADFTAKAGVSSGQFLVGIYSSTYTTGKMALLVAGYDAADTTSATNYLIDKGSTEVDATKASTMLKTTANWVNVA